MAINDKKTTQIKDDRLKICNPCEFAKAGFCKKCGCILAAKTRVKTEKCPIDKW